MAFWAYQVYIISYFLHLTNRIPVLGSIRFDMLMFVFLFGAAAFDWGSNGKHLKDDVAKKLIVLICFIVLSVPFVAFPGSVIHYGFKYFSTGSLFFFFTVFFVRTPQQFFIFVHVFLFCQTFRVLEPVYLHITTGYYGSFASTTGEFYLDRLSGSPYDVVNPNGLALIIDIIVPLYWYLSQVSRWHKWLGYCLIPVSVYALLLTGSRSGFVGFVVFCFFAWWVGKKKILGVLFGIIVIMGSLPFLSTDLQDRYLSIVSSNTQNNATKEGRIQGWSRDFSVAMHKPIVGHGIGTSLEANVNESSTYLVSHNLLFETWQEIGFIGVVLFSAYLYAIWKKLKSVAMRADGEKNVFVLAVTNGMLSIFWVNLVFSIFSYGLSSYKWHLMGGIAVVLSSILALQSKASTDPPRETVS